MSVARFHNMMTTFTFVGLMLAIYTGQANGLWVSLLIAFAIQSALALLAARSADMQPDVVVTIPAPGVSR